MAQLVKIGVTIEWRQDLKVENKKKKSGNNEEGSNDGPRESQKERTPLSTFCQYNGFVILIFFNFIFFFCDLIV